MRHTPLTLSILVLATAAAACSGKSHGDDDDEAVAGSGGSGGMGAAGKGGMGGAAVQCPDANADIDPTALIDDLEDGDAYTLKNGGINGGWWTASDDTGGTMLPEQADITGELAAPELLPEARCGSNYALRVTGQGFTDWGAVLGLSLVFGTRPNGEEGAVAYDASARTGVMFWAKIGDTSVNRVRYEISDSNTEPDGGVCVEDGPTGKTCYDSFGVDIPNLGTEWRHYTIPFAGLAQRDFGVQTKGVQVDAVYQVTFNFLTSDVFDFYVDDISFY